MANYYFRRISDGEKVMERSLAEINAKAKREANKFGQAIQVFVDKAERGVGMKSHRQVSMARNPVSKHVEMWYNEGKQYSLERRANGSYDLENDRQGVLYTMYGTLKQNRDRLTALGFSRKRTMARNPVPKLRPHVGSWAIIEKKTGKVVTEIWRDDPRIKTLNLAKYKAVPIDVHLASLSVKRNPIDFSPPEYSYFQARGDARGAEVARARKPKRMAAHKRRGWVGGAKAAGGSRKPFVVVATKAGKSQTFKTMTLREAKEIAEAMADNGFKATVSTND